MTRLSLRQLRRHKVVEEVEVDSLYEDWIVILKPGYCWEEEGVHTRGFPPGDRDLIGEDLKFFVEPCRCVDCMFWVLDS